MKMQIGTMESIQSISHRQAAHSSPRPGQSTAMGEEPLKGMLPEMATEVTEAYIISSIERANKSLELTTTRFEFSIHEQTKEIMVKVFDEQSGDLIREIPPEKILNMIAKLWELAGILVDEHV
jgi:uncharacterized FlaG/YvyC family protein